MRPARADGLGDELWLDGKYYEAMDTYREALALGKTTGRTAHVVWLLERLGGAGSEGDFVRAARLLGAAENLRYAIQLPRPEYCAPEFEENVAYARNALGPEAFLVAWTEGQAMSLEELVTYASDGVTVDDEVWGGGQ